jgi:GDP-L-fucose synthase
MRSINFVVPNMYGPHDSTDPNKAHALNALAAKFVKAKREQLKRVEVWGTGVAVREWLFAGDFARIIVETLSRLDEQHFDTLRSIAQNDGWSVRQLVDELVRAIGFDGEVVWDRAKPDGAPRKVMDDALFRKAFPDFRFTPFREGLKKTIEFYESIYPF